jgi:hypothetical protein
LVLIVLSLGGASPNAGKPPEPPAVRPRIMSDEKYDRLRDLLPRVSDAEIQRILDDERLVLYTDEEMPPAYQDWDGGLPGIHSVRYNVSANQSEPFGNANLEFPWGTPAGTHRTKNVRSFRFLWLPVDRHGNTQPVVWYRILLPGDSAKGYAWIFPVGTVLGEVLLAVGSDQEQYPFELRIRTRQYAEWSVDVFRPFVTAADLLDRIKQDRPDWWENETLVQLVNHLDRPITMPKLRLADNHSRLVFDQPMGVDSLPPIGEDDLVADLLTRTEFQSALGAVWRHDTKGLYTCAPTTEADFHIVPANYDAGFIEVDPVSCMRCHETVAVHAREFDFGRDWYGRVRGSDGIFSFHPFDPASISPNGYGRPVQMRAELVENGVLEKFDPEKHANEVYHLLPRGTN